MRRAPVPSAADAGLMTGPPPYPADRLVTLANWQEPPYNRWAFQHVRELIPTARISRGSGAAWRLPRAERDLSRVRVRAAGRRIRLASLLEQTYTDGFLVLHRGRIVTEHYANDLTPDTTHLLMSVSKSVVSSVVGVLVGRGLLRPSDLVTDHLPDLRGTSFEECTVRHLLDMRAGTRFEEDYANLEADVRVYEEVYLWRPRSDRALPDDIVSYYRILENAGPHGGPFGYRSILTDVLGWVAERVSNARLADLIARELWQPMGAEFDAEITVDAHGNAMADGGMCCTLRDLARFGQLMLQRGRRARRDIVPSSWVRDTLTPDADTVRAFADEARRRGLPTGSYYRNQWWVIDPSRPSFMASGINGQMVLVDVPTSVVIAKLSTWPEALPPDLPGLTRSACLDLARQLAEELD
jgi:CubicO group peptidase (beta-lactamase class C family)